MNRASGKTAVPRWRRILNDAVLMPLGILIILVLFPVGVVAYLLFSLALHVRIWWRWCRRGRDILFIHSSSPIWADYIADNILPRIEHRAVLLNWSERAQWSRSLERTAFKHFGGSREFNPMAVVFRPLRPARVFRFYQPFHDYKHGKPLRLQEIQTRFFDAIGEAGNAKSSIT